MSAPFSFRELVGIVTADPALEGMKAIVEKELLHYELLHILGRNGWPVGLGTKRVTMGMGDDKTPALG